MDTKKVTITFTIPAEWDADAFILEVVGSYDDMAGENAEAVSYVARSVA